MSIKHFLEDKLILLLVYVNDMTVEVDGDHEKQIFKENLVAQLAMKYLGKLKYFLAIEVACLKKDIYIIQRKYVLDLLKETSKIGCK